MSTRLHSTRTQRKDNGRSDAAAVRIAAVQMASGPRVESNLKEAAWLIETAVEQGAKLVALPEYFGIMGMKDTDKVAVREEFGKGPIQEFLSDTAKKHGIWIVGGSVPLVASSPKKVMNTSLVYDNKGKCVARYDKIHLFGFEMGDERYSEKTTIEHGKQVVAFDTPFGRIGLSICYDLRFPEYFRQLGEVDILILPAAFTATTGEAHWEVLLRARAIENQCYVIASAQGGRHETGRKTWGHSMIVDPWGEILSVLPAGEGWVCANFSRQRLETIRHRLPALKHRRIRS